MPTIRLNYLDLSTEQRRNGAKAVRARLQTTLANPSLSQEQAKQLKDQLQKIDAWETGTLGKSALTPATVMPPIKMPGALASKTPDEIRKMMQEIAGKKK